MEGEDEGRKIVLQYDFDAFVYYLVLFYLFRTICTLKTLFSSSAQVVLLVCLL